MVIAPSRGRAQCRERHAGGVKSGDGGCAQSAKLYSPGGDALLAHGIGTRRGGQAILPNRSSGSALDGDVQHGGIDALTTKRRPGRGRRVKLERLRDLLVPVLENPSQAGELHWTGVKVHGWLKEQLGLEVGYSTTVRYLHELRYNLRVPRPWPERQNEEERNAFLVQLRTCQADRTLELWFADECGVEGDPRPRRRWSARGSRPKVPYLGDHIRENVIGAVCPATGECCTMIFDGVDTDVFQYYLDHLAQEIPAVDSKRRLLIVDNASWHKAQRLNWHHFEIHYLPGYSPDFNPIERLWLRLKADFFSDFIAKSPDELTQRLCHALTSFMNDPEKVASQCAFRK